MAIFTTLRLTVVLSTILPCAPDSYSRLIIQDFSQFLTNFISRGYPPSSTTVTVAFRGDFRRFGGFLSCAVPDFILPVLRTSLLCCVCPPLRLSLRSYPSTALPTFLNVSQTSLPLQPHPDSWGNPSNRRKAKKNSIKWLWTSLIFSLEIFLLTWKPIATNVGFIFCLFDFFLSKNLFAPKL